MTFWLGFHDINMGGKYKKQERIKGARRTNKKERDNGYVVDMGEQQGVGEVESRSGERGGENSRKNI